jgi:electron transport complex protein RnfB
VTSGDAQPTLRAERLLDALPQTQCKRCGYQDCAAYAQAMAQGDADINQCAPGGAEGIRRLQAITGAPNASLNPDFGEEGPRTVAYIDEDWCIGCTLCITACPVDAIIGSNKRMHTVIEAHCTGCELCLPVCPVDCILLENVTGERTGWAAWSPAQALEARQRHHISGVRRQREAEELQVKRVAKAELKLSDLAAHSQHTDPAILDKKRAVIQAALARARALRAP